MKKFLFCLLGSVLCIALVSGFYFYHAKIKYLNSDIADAPDDSSQKYYNEAECEENQLKELKFCEGIICGYICHDCDKCKDDETNCNDEYCLLNSNY